VKAVAVTPGKKESARMIEVDAPDAKAGEVIVKVMNVGIDGTDVEINAGLYGDAPFGSDFLVLGHESLGVVEKGFGSLKKGDLVAATVRRPCPENCSWPARLD